MVDFNINSNNYGITANEWKRAKQNIKTNDKKNEAINLTSRDYKTATNAIKSGNLMGYLNGLNDEMKKVMGLELVNIVDDPEALNDIKTMLKTLSPECAKLTETYINQKVYDRIELSLAEAETMDILENLNDVALTNATRNKETKQMISLLPDNVNKSKISEFTNIASFEQFNSLLRSATQQNSAAATWASTFTA